jgi:hypothetical protein
VRTLGKAPKPEGRSLGTGRRRWQTIDGMEIVINVDKSTTGRLAGSVRPAGSQSATDFDGTMELLAAVEHICAADDASESP